MQNNRPAGISQQSPVFNRDLRYSRLQNPSFKSQLMNMVMVHPFEQPSYSVKNLRRQSQPNYLDQVDLAARDFMNKRVSNPNPEKALLLPQSPIQLPIKQAARLPLILNKVQHSRTQQPPVAAQRSKSTATLPKYAPNDEGIFVKQSKPYNIISNYPHEVNNLRVHPKLSTEFKQRTFFWNYIAGKTEANLNTMLPHRP